MNDNHDELGRFSSSPGMGSAMKDEAGVAVSKDVNHVELLHSTPAVNVGSIQNEGFRLSTNSMYGQGVYFADRAAYSNKENVLLKAELSPHKQLFIDDDTDASRIYRAITGVDQFHPRFREKIIEAGYKSARINMGEYDGNQVTTVVFDPSVIVKNKIGVK